MDFQKEIEILSALAHSLRETKELGEKQEILLSNPKVITGLHSAHLRSFLLHAHDLSSKIALFAIAAINQHEIIFSNYEKHFSKEKARSLIALFVSIDRFYENIGGIVGYQVHALTLLLKNREVSLKKKGVFKQAEVIDYSITSDKTMEAILTGIRAIDEMGEIYPIGGLGSRLNLMSKTAEPLPAACLPFCGRTLLEGLIRDVQAREFLYYRLFNKHVCVPIAMMTSLEKKNAQRVRMICEKRKWFGRPRESFLLFSQISVPVITEEGKWSMKSPLEPNLQPGGHGALWKAAEERGVFFWFQCHEKKHLLIRQINNPVSGIDYSLLALIGHGKKENKTFGFACCQRLPNAAEGVLVLVEEEEKKCLSNIEYTDLKRYGINDLPTKDGFSHYPANTNILYANLEQILPVVKKNPLPGLILNMKNKEPFYCPLGHKQELIGGRLESMMQNISDAMEVDVQDSLVTFLTYNERRKTISTTKKSYDGGDSLLETPEGAFYDLLYNGYTLLTNVCGATIGQFSSPENYLKNGPSLLFLYHPALGPLYALIAQKICKGFFAEGSELQLEIADFYAEQLSLDGTCLVYARNLLGHDSQGTIRYSQKTGKCILKNVTVINKGINRKISQDYWKNKIKRFEALKIVLQGHSEFYAEDVTFKGHHMIVVPDGERWIAKQKEDGEIEYQIEKPDWKWSYKEESNQIVFCRTNLS